ncbi:hypothetical protein MK292_04190 [Myxococcota bacterium]|nr:hypothetical protein [Myxococcota bacterium]
MEAKKTTIKETVSASKKLGEADARDLLKSASKLVVAKGKKLSESAVPQRVTKELVASLLGPTGNLRAPCLKVGKTLIVGFNEQAFGKLFG